MELFKPEVEYFRVNNIKGNFFRYNGWPTVCKDDRGVLYTTASSYRMSHVDPCGKNCMYLSFNEGKTWTSPIIVNDSYIDDRDMGITYCGNGKMVVTWFNELHPEYWEHLDACTWFDRVDVQVVNGIAKALRHLPEGTCEKLVGAYVKVSEDYGVTWSDPIRVPLTNPHGVSVCADGTLIFMGKKMDPEYGTNDPIVVYSSHDGGYTWEFTGEVPLGEGLDGYVDMHEPHAIELPNGRLLGAIRVHNAEFFTTFITFSDDKGKTWSTPKRIGELDGAPPHLMVHSSGAVICSYSCRTYGKMGEKAVVSYDNGETWTEDYELDLRVSPNQHDLGYPSTVELEDGSLYTVYYQAYGDEDMTSLLACKWRLNGK